MEFSEVRAKYPQYNDLNDTQLADALHTKFYPDVPKPDFYVKIGLVQPGPAHRAVTPPQQQTAQNFGRGLDPSLLNSVGTGVNDMFQGATQSLIHALPESVINAGNKLGTSMGLSGYDARQADQQLALREQHIQGDRKNRGLDGLDYGRLAGNIVGTLPLAASLPAPAGILKGAAVGAGTGLLTGAASPVTDTSKPYAEQKTQQLETSTGLGALTGGAGGLLGKFISPQVNQDVQTLMQKGVTPTPGQIMGGTAARTEEKLTSIPGLGDMIKNSQRRAVEQFNKAVANEALAPIGQKTTEAAGRGLIDDVATKISGAYKALLPKLTFKADPQLMGDLFTLTNAAKNLPEAQAKQFEKILQTQVMGKIANTKTLSVDGMTFKGVEEEIGDKATGYMSDPSFDNRQLGSALGELQKALRAGLERSNPAHAGELGQINKAYAMYARIRDAGSRVGTDAGVFTPAQMLSAVRSGDKSAGKGQFARGNALSQDLAEAGKNVLGNKYPDSGTSGRMWAGGAAGLLSGAIHPAIPIGLGAAALPYTGAGSRVMAGLLAKRPEMASPLKGALLQLLPAMSAGAAIGGNQ